MKFLQLMQKSLTLLAVLVVWESHGFLSSSSSRRSRRSTSRLVQPSHSSSTSSSSSSSLGVSMEDRVTTMEASSIVESKKKNDDDDNEYSIIKKQDSARLSKAKQLLQQFTVEQQELPDSTSATTATATKSGTQNKNQDQNNVILVKNGRSTTTGGGIRTSTTMKIPSDSSSVIRNNSNNSNRQVMTNRNSKPRSNSSKSVKLKAKNNVQKQKQQLEEEEQDNNVVPDQFWSNGHLQGGDYVTRWARGVKVAEPLVKYDPVVAEKLLFKQPAKWVTRNAQIAFPTGYWALNVATDYLLGRSKQNRKQRAKQLLSVITNLGPAIIKGGQALSSRPDLLPSEYLEELQKLQDDVPRFSNRVAFQTVDEELGIAFEDVFELVEEEPVAAASIGQVYKARLLSNGDTVALKIQRPRCEEVIALDLYILRWWSGVYNGIFKLLNRDIDLQSIIDDFGELIYREIDYVAEAANAQRFNELYAGVTDVFVPKIYSELTTSKVLTMEWVDGFRLTDANELARYGLDPSKLVNTLVQCSLKQVLENGYFHADPHAGNLLACPDGRLCYLDFGMMSYADSSQRNGFLLAVVHIVNRDWSELARLYVKLGFIPEGTDLKPIEVALEDALPEALNADITELNFKSVVNKLGDIMYTYPFSLPPFYISIIRCLGVLEGLAIQVDPQARIVSKAYPYIASRVLTDPQDDLQEALRRLALTSDGKVRWSRLESLLEEAKGTSDYDVTAALDMLTNFLISDEGEGVVDELANQIVDAADSLGAETYRYVFDAARALAINDEVAAVKAFRSLQDILQQDEEAAAGFDGVRQKVKENLSSVLPEPTPSMRRFASILSLLGAQQGQSADVAKFVPILRKLGQEPRIQRTLNEIIAKLGERILSRGLRAAFGLPPPVFGDSASSTVTEDSFK